MEIFHLNHHHLINVSHLFTVTAEVISRGLEYSEAEVYIIIVIAV